VEGGWPGEGNIDADPLFVDADVAGDLHLLGGSPCLDAGDNSAIPAWMTKDVEGNPRIVNGTVDMGAYEGPNQGLVVRPLSVTVGEGQTTAFTVALGLDPQGTVEVTIAIESGDPDISVQSGTILTFNSSNYSQARPVTLAAAEDDDHIEGTSVVSVSASGFNTLIVNVTEAENDHVLYVDTNASGANTGMNWADAFESLQEALSAASENPHINEIRVAHGTYRPDQGAGITPGDRKATFQLINGVAIKGGYAGCGEPDPDARDIELYETILSGDLDGNDIDVNDPCDLLTEGTRSENSYHVITWIGIACHEPEPNTLLDGFTVSGGNANGKSNWPDEWSCGGGLYNYSGKSSMITKCKFTGNSASNDGGGIWGWRGPIVNCLITKNAAGWNGGGLSQCSGLIKGCTISGNFAAYRGGGYEMWEGDTHFHNCTFSNNTAGTDGGGMFFADASPRLSHCTFSGNVAGGNGGGISSVLFDYAPTPVLINCDFSQNTASEAGGGMCNTSSYSRLTNCIFSGNSARHGGGMANYDGSDLNLANCTFAENSGQNGNALTCDSYNPQYPWPSELQLSNCILWDGGDEIWNNDNSTISVTYSDVQGSWLGEGNIDAVPCFADPGIGDYHLKSQGGRWEPSRQNWIQDNVTSPCIDAGNMASPIGIEPFPNGGIINMGAYGGTAEASKSYFGGPVCKTIVAGDINGDCKVNFLDFRLMALHWLEGTR
jgi:predicted outer membrane repeat protein